MSEFDIIHQYFADLTDIQTDVVLGIGDDCALLTPPPGKQLVASMDTLVSGRHFLPEVNPVALGHKALAVNLSDLAAMGATPAWAMLSLTLPDINHEWLSGFCKGFADLAKAHEVQLIGGDTTSGPLSITVQITGFVDVGSALTRSGARPGDKIFVSGSLGDAGLGLKIRTGKYSAGNTDNAILRLEQPEPRVVLGNALRNIASAAIDVSDGLLADLRHICDQSQVGAAVHIESLPISNAVSAYIESSGDGYLPLSAGDDYELCFTVPAENKKMVERLALEIGLPLTEIGEIMALEAGIQVLDVSGQTVQVITAEGYDHFIQS